MKWLFRLGAAALLLVLALQLWPVTRTNPPVDPALTLNAPEAVAYILRESCYNCHSNETKWRWYAYVAPVSWKISRDVTNARANLNFSLWNSYKRGEQLGDLHDMAGDLKQGVMPPSIYVKMHVHAALGKAEADALAAWCKAEIQRLADAPKVAPLPVPANFNPDPANADP